jgi:hypothetical protein
MRKASLPLSRVLGRKAVFQFSAAFVHTLQLYHKKYLKFPHESSHALLSGSSFLPSFSSNNFTLSLPSLDYQEPLRRVVTRSFRLRSIRAKTMILSHRIQSLAMTHYKVSLLLKRDIFQKSEICHCHGQRNTPGERCI